MNELLNEQATGVYVISATPFADDGAIDYPSADRLIEHYLAEGVHGITLLGVMGEAPKLTDTEQTDFMGHMLARIDARVPTIVGVSNPGIDNLTALSRRAMDAGAAGVMVAGIPVSRPTIRLTPTLRALSRPSARRFQFASRTTHRPPRSTCRSA